MSAEDLRQRLVNAGREAGAVLRHTRKSAGLSQQEVAQRVGTPASYINKMEAGGRGVSPRMAERLAVALTNERPSEAVTPIADAVARLEREVANLRHENATLRRTLDRFRELLPRGAA